MPKKPKKFFKSKPKEEGKEEKIVKKQRQTQKSPKISRSITESFAFLASAKLPDVSKSQWWKANQLWINLFCLFLLGSIVIVAVQGKKAYDEFQNLRQERQLMQEKLTYWKQVVQEYPGYRDAYIQMADISFRLGDIRQATEEIDKALVLDPNFQPAIQLKKYMSGEK